MRATYLLPVRFQHEQDIEELTGYLRGLPDWIELIVVDGSPEPVFERNAGAWAPLGRHLPPDPDLVTRMGKVGGVLTGLREAGTDAVVIADDDVRYEEPALVRAVLMLGLAECVRPQNYFEPLPWHAHLDTARTLINRALGADFPGTLAVRRSAVLAAGGYDGDVIFENLELIRTIEASGGRVLSPLDLYVARRPPSTDHFLSQRVRQAYDDFAIPVRMAAWLAMAPALAVALLRRRPRAPIAAALGGIGLAEIGRRRAGGAHVFPATSSTLAPLWLLERAVCSWLAVRERLLRGGVRYGDDVVPRSASSVRELRRRRGAEADQLVGAVAEGLPPRSPAAA